MTKLQNKKQKKRTKLKICYMVSNDITHDPRVKKQIESASKNNLDVLALGFGYPCLTNTIKNQEKIGDLVIKRGIYKYPYRIPNVVKYLVGGVRVIFGLFLSLPLFLGLKPKPTFENNPKLVNENKDVAKENFFKKANLFFAKNFNFISSFSFYMQMTRFLANEGIKYRPQIVHANDLDTLLAGYFIKKKTGAKLIYDAHEIWTKQGLILPPIIIFAFAQIERFMLGKIDAFISVNKSIIEEISKMYHHNFKIKTLPVYNCPPYQNIRYNKRSRKEVKVLYQGRYCFDRGLEELALAARYLPDNIVIYFRATGDPLTKMRLDKIIENYGLEKKVKFLRPVDMEDMVISAKDFDIGVIPYIPVNINNKLCTPNKLFEYMGSGLVLAVSDLPELRHFVNESKNGAVFNPRSPRSIANTIIKLSKNRLNLDQMRKNSLDAAKIYNWQNEEKKLLDLYYEITQ